MFERDNGKWLFFEQTIQKMENLFLLKMPRERCCHCYTLRSGGFRFPASFFYIIS